MNPNHLTGVIVADPTIRELVDGYRLYEGRVRLEAGGEVLPVLFLPDAPGVGWKWSAGQRVEVELRGGKGYVTRAYVSTVADGTNHVIQAPAGGAILAGAGTGGSWEALMLHAGGHQDFLQLKASLDTAMASLILALGFLEAIPTTAGVAAAANLDGLTLSKSDLQAVTGGKATSGLKGRAAS